MIKVAVSGADTPSAGELIRLLVNHPEVDIIALSAPGKEGKTVTSIHHGLQGEIKHNFSGTLNTSPLPNVIFICGNAMNAAEYKNLRHAHPEMKSVIIDPIEALDHKATGVVYGLSEINRKLLVRGATAAVVPSPPASLALVALYPLALHMLINNSLKINVKLPADMIPVHSDRSRLELKEILNDVQRSFTGVPEVMFEESDDPRHMEIDIEMECPLDLQQLMELYEMYDDHNFALPLLSEVDSKDVTGTEKALMKIAKENDGRIHLHAVADPRMRGGAGEAVHIMNLLCGLHEKTGLALKASEF